MTAAIRILGFCMGNGEEIKGVSVPLLAQ